MLLLQRQGHSMIQRWQNTISRNGVLALSSTSTTICGGNIVTAVRPLSLYSTSTLQQNYNEPSQISQTATPMIKQSHIYQRQYQLQISNSLIHNYDTNNQLRWFTSGGRHIHHGGRGRSDRGRDHQSRNRIPMVKDCRTLDDAIVPYYENLEILTPRNLSAFWAAVPRLLRYQKRGVNNLVSQLEAIFLKTADQIHSYEPRDLVTTILGFAKTIQALQRSKRGCGSGSYEGYLHGILIRQRDAVFSFLARTAVNKLDQIEPRHISNLAYAYAILEFVPKLNDGSTLFDHIAEKSIPLLGKFKPQELSNTVWAFEKVKEPHPKLFKKVAHHIVSLDHLNDFKPQDLSIIVLAYAKAGVSHPKLFERVGDHIVSLEHLNNFKPQELSNIIYAYAKAKVSHPNLFNKVADHIVMLELDNFDPQALSNIVWAFEKVKVSHPTLYERVADHIVSLEHLNDFNSQELANILIAYAKAEISHPDLFTRIGDHIVTLTLHDFKPQELSNTVWAFEKVKVPHLDLFKRIGDHIVTRQQLNDFAPQAFANIVYAYAKAGVSHRDLFNKVADHIISLDNLDDYDDQDLCNLAWAYNKAGVICQDLNNKLKDAAVDRKEEFSSRNLNNIYHWTSEEEDMQNQEDDEQNENDCVAPIVDDDDDNAHIKDEILVEDDTTSSVPEDLSLLTVVQLKDRLRNLGLRVSGRKQELIDRLNDHIQSQ